jgi:catechol 2,3-dioxygenase-like lactoylglutathione lyase family enzyme
MHPTGIYETILYGEDLDAMERFYREVIGLRLVSKIEGRSRGFRVSPAQMLLIFRASRTTLGHPTVPAHGATGAGHVAFSIERGTYGAWRARLVEAGLEIEKEVEWPVAAAAGVEGTGARSMYARDPAGNSVELVEGDLWPA